MPSRPPVVLSCCTPAYRRRGIGARGLDTPPGSAVSAARPARSRPPSQLAPAHRVKLRDLRTVCLPRNLVACLEQHAQVIWRQKTIIGFVQRANKGVDVLAPVTPASRHREVARVH